MVQINLQPYIMRDVLLTLTTTGDTPTAVGDFEKHVSQVELTPTSSVVVFKGLTPEAVYSFGAAATWACTLAFAQDWETENSLSRYLFEHEGEEVTALFEPVKGGKSVTAQLILTPSPIGGTVDAVSAGTVTLGVKGKPVLEAAA